MATMATTMAIHLQAKKLMNSSPKPSKPPSTTTKSLSLQNLIPKSLTSCQKSSSATAAVIAGAVFSSLSRSEAAIAAQQIADMAEGGGDNRGLALLIPLVPAILWVLYNILQPALNQINRMRSDKAVVVGLGAGLAALTVTSSSSAAEIAVVADAGSSDNRGLLLLFVVAPAVVWVLYNILQPALNQINRMRSGSS